MGNSLMVEEYPAQKERAGVCYTSWREKKMENERKKDPYGKVPYADPGYQKDGVKRYPIDTEEHVRAAWSYINMPKNRKPYSEEQLKSIESKIISAAKRFGIKIAVKNEDGEVEESPDLCEQLEQLTRGRGQGVGGPRQGDGGTDACKCPECGATAFHPRGVPCVEIKCPKCGTAMVGK